MVVLLGPVGSGKSRALRKISEDCGGGVVHARFDFDLAQPVTTVEVLAHLAFVLSRPWPARRPARFLRFTLGLIAVLTPLDTLTWDEARNKLQDEIDRVLLRSRKLDAWVQTLTETAVQTQVLTSSLAQAINVALPRLVQAIERRSLRRAGNWHTDMPEAAGAASALDALVMLNWKARGHSADMTAWLTAAFLADVRENHLRMSTPDVHARCSCAVPERAPHLHNWVLLLDNLHLPGGQQFVTDLLAARESELLQRPGEHDALLVVASSGRWNADWQTAWPPPWKSPQGQSDGARVVPWCRNADYAHWAGILGPNRRPYPYYPLLLEPLDSGDVGSVVAGGHEMVVNNEENRVRCALIGRATGGLPERVETVAWLLRGRELVQGSRDALRPDNLGHAAATWGSQVATMQLTAYLPGIGVDDVVSAAAFATAPWLVHADPANMAAAPQVGRILTELRTALWVIAPLRGRGTSEHAELQPWIARILLGALVERRSADGEPSYDEQFMALLRDPATRADPVRTAYCHLALGRIAEVSDYFEANFQGLAHQRWVEQLELVTGAPDDKPLDRSCEQIYEELVAEDLKATGAERTRVRNLVARLIAARWLVANPFTTPTSTLRDVIVTSYEGLIRESHRGDVAPLHAAAEHTQTMF